MLCEILSCQYASTRIQDNLVYCSGCIINIFKLADRQCNHRFPKLSRLDVVWQLSLPEKRKDRLQRNLVADQEGEVCLIYHRCNMPILFCWVRNATQPCLIVPRLQVWFWTIYFKRFI